MDKKLNLLYLGYIGFNNIGDEVCYQAFLQHLKKRNIDCNVILFDLYTKEPVDQICQRTPLDGVVMGGGSLWQGSAFIIPAQQAISLGLPVWVFGTGIDYFTEEYVEKLKDETLPVPVADTFDNKDINEYAIQWILGNCPFIGVRGPLTYRFFTRLYNDEDIQIIGDPGLIYTPVEDTSMLDAARIEPGSKFIAVNWGGSFNSVFGHDEQGTLFRFAEGIQHLINKGYHILIYPMWRNDVENCSELFGAVGGQQCSLISTLGSIDSYCTMLNQAEFSINFKLHGNVLSALVGTPFITLAYRSKSYDFAMSVEAEELCISTGSNNIANLIPQMEKRIIENRDYYKKKLSEYRSLYQKYYDKFFDRLVSFYGI